MSSDDVTFTKMARKDAPDASQGLWAVKVPMYLPAESGEVVTVTKGDGSTVLQRLVIEVPFASPTVASQNRRWTCDDVEAEIAPDDLAEDTEAEDTETEPQIRLEPLDDKPSWWSRKPDGRVLWPRDGDVWSRRSDGVEGEALRDRLNSRRIAWSGFNQDGTSADPQWMTPSEFMEIYSFISR